MVGSAAFFMSGVCGLGGKASSMAFFAFVMKWQQNLGEAQIDKEEGGHASPVACQGTGGNNPAEGIDC
jgi:hypothetical protein